MHWTKNILVAVGFLASVAIASSIDLRAPAATLPPGATGTDLTLSGLLRAGTIDAGAGMIANNLSVGGTIISNVASGGTVMSLLPGAYISLDRTNNNSFIRAPVTGQIEFSTNTIVPASNDSTDIGTSSLKFKGAHFAQDVNMASDKKLCLNGTTCTRYIYHEDSPDTLRVGGDFTMLANGLVTSDFSVGTGGSGDLINYRHIYMRQSSTNKLTFSGTAPTVVACSGTAASITSANGTAAFQLDVGTSCASESTVVLTMPAANVGWSCACSSTTAGEMLQQKVMPSASTTVVTMQNILISSGANQDFTDGADVACQCTGL